MNVIHFKNQKDRLDFLKGNFEEIVPVEAVENDNLTAESAEKPQKKASKRKKSPSKAKEDGKNDKVQAK